MTDTDTTAAVAAAGKAAFTPENVLHRHREDEGRPGRCYGCGERWPCDAAVMAAEVERWRADWHRVETLLSEIQATADGGGMAGHDMSEDLRRFKLISDLVDIIWQTDATHPATAGRGSED